MQKCEKLVRAAAYSGHAVDVDINDCYGRLLLLSLQEEHLYSEQEHLLIALSTLHYRKWRLALARYMGVDVQQSKQEILCIRFGSVSYTHLRAHETLSDL
eukprot:9818947-Karenia_brevis.AAC.1